MENKTHLPRQRVEDYERRHAVDLEHGACVCTVEGGPCPMAWLLRVAQASLRVRDQETCLCSMLERCAMEALRTALEAQP